MKKQFLIFLTAVVILSSCTENGELGLDDEIVVGSIAALDLGAEEAMSSGFDEIDLLTEDGMLILENELNVRFRTDHDGGEGHPGDREPRTGFLDCATVDVNSDSESGTVTIDFGEGCPDPRGITRSGKIIITFSGDKHEAGSYRTVTLENFTLDTLQLEGSMLVEVLSAAETHTSIQSTLTGGKVTFPDATFATRESTHVRDMYRGDAEEDNYISVTGSSSGVRTDGNSYTITITSPLIRSRACHEERVAIPVSGVKEIVSGDSNATIDFGDGTCDNDVEVTIDGVTETITVEPKMPRPHDRPKGRRH